MNVQRFIGKQAGLGEGIGYFRLNPRNLRKES